MSMTLRVLMVEDSEDDAAIIVRHLKRAGYKVAARRVETETDMSLALDQENWDLIISDYRMPAFSTPAALALMQSKGLDLPFIMVSGTIGEDRAVSVMKAGAHDYIMKNNLARLVPAVERELKEAEERQRRKRAEQALRESDERLNLALKSAEVGTWAWDITSDRLVWDDYLYPLYGLTKDRKIHRHSEFIALIHPQDRARVEHAVHEALAHNQEFDIEYRVIWPSGTVRCLTSRGRVLRGADGQPYRMSGVCWDITERKRLEERLIYQAGHDALTDLPNRSLIYDQLRQALMYARRYDYSVAVLFLDLDRFKRVNDTLGHHAGDELLRAVAVRLNSCVRESDSVGRHGGDEFVIVLAGLQDVGDIQAVLQNIRQEFRRSFTIQGQELAITYSVGIAHFPVDGDNPDTLLRNADSAMYRAKEQGRNTSQFYSPDMNARAHELFTLETELSQAIHRDELCLYYQPQISLATRRVVAVEALMRWQRPSAGVVSPAQFVPLLEDSGQIVAFGEWALRAACAQLRHWRDLGLAPLRVAVNLSTRQLQRPDFVEMVMQTLKEEKVSADLIEFEITESSLMLDIPTNVDKLKALAAQGLSFAIDDFGTGYSSLSYLMRLPIKALKIDLTFVREVTSDSTSATISAAILALGHNLQLQVVAEGVETPDQLKFFETHRCDCIQGYLASPPLPPDAIHAYLRRGSIAL